MTRLGEGLGAGAANQAGLILQVREEGVPFVLDAGLEAGQEAYDQGGERAFAGALEGVGIGAGGVAQLPER